MTKGSARVALFATRELLVELLAEFRCLEEIRERLKGNGVVISHSSLYRFLISELPSEYANYLRVTGRGLVRSRGTEGQRSDPPNAHVVAANSQLDQKKINNRCELNKFLKNGG